MSSECPKCRNRMVEGFVKDDTHGEVHVSHWVEGAPEKSFWTGTKTRGKKAIRIMTFRCGKCGYLESYANEQQGE